MNPHLVCTLTLQFVSLLSVVLYTCSCCADQYSQPSMANFTNDPLLCEPYAWQPAQSDFLTVKCPYPNTLTRFSLDQWPESIAGVLCPSNNDIQCAADKTPLTTTTYNAVMHTLDAAKLNARLIAAAGKIASCQHTSTVLGTILSKHCGKHDLSHSLLSSWISVCVLGGAGALLLTNLLLVHRTTPPFQANTIGAAFAPGMSTHDTCVLALAFRMAALNATVVFLICCSNICPNVPP